MPATAPVPPDDDDVLARPSGPADLPQLTRALDHLAAAALELVVFLDEDPAGDVGLDVEDAHDRPPYAFRRVSNARLRAAPRAETPPPPFADDLGTGESCDRTPLC